MSQQNIVSIGMDDLHNEALKQNRLQKEAIEQAKRNGVTFSQTELDDIKKLNARRDKSKGTLKFDKKLSGEDLVIAKQLEAKRGDIYGNFANPNFDLGLPNTATQKDRDFMIKQSQEHRMQQQKAEQNKINAQRQTEQGKQLQKQIGTSTEEQQKNLLKSGIKLNTGALSPRALAKLREKGLI